MTSVVPDEDKSMRFACVLCRYHCKRRNDLQKHFGTQKHAWAAKQASPLSPVPVVSNSTHPSVPAAGSTYDCLCGKAYRHSTSLYKHRRSCEFFQSQIMNVCMDPVCEGEGEGEGEGECVADSDAKSASLLIALLGEQAKYTKDLKTMLEQQGKQLVEVAAKVESSSVTNHVTTINNTNKFNLNVFLNSDCKDAMNVMDFVQMIEVTSADLERLADVGYVEGVARIMMDGLRKLDVCQRPIHCTDVKRESFYIKDNNVWEKDNANGDKMRLVVKHVAHRNMVALPDWQKENPAHTDFSTRTHEQYLRIVNAAFGGSTQHETDNFRNKIIRKAAPELVAPKKSLRVNVNDVVDA
jgi:hypothetical protein